MTRFVTKPWTEITDAMIAEDAPGSPAFWKAMRDNDDHLRQVLYQRFEGDDYTDDVPHVHRGKHDQHPDPQVSHNLVRTSHPDSDAFDKDRWFRSGFADYGDSDVITSHGHAGDYLFENLPSFPGLYGGFGGTFVASMMIRASNAPTRGEVSFGIGSGGMDGGAIGLSSIVIVDKVKGFHVGSRCAIDHTDLSTSWQRFYAVLENVGAQVRELVRFQVLITETLDCSVDTTAFAVTPGRQLRPYYIAAVEEFKGSDTELNNTRYDNVPGTATDPVPIFDWVIGMDNAVRVYPV